MPLGRHAAGRYRGAGPRSQGKSPPPRRANRAAAKHGAIQLAAGVGPKRFSISRPASILHPRTGNRSTTRPPRKWPSRTGNSRCSTDTKLDAVFLTNNFDDPLTDFDTKRYIPCLRTDDLVFHLGKAEVRQRLEKGTNTAFTTPSALRYRDSVSCSSTSWRTARGPARFRLPPAFAPLPSRRRRPTRRSQPCSAIRPPPGNITTR